MIRAASTSHKHSLCLCVCASCMHLLSAEVGIAKESKAVPWLMQKFRMPIGVLHLTWALVEAVYNK